MARRLAAVSRMPPCGLLGLIVLGCGEPTGSDGCFDAEAERCSVSEPDCVRRLGAGTACLLELSDFELPPVRVVGVDALIEERRRFLQDPERAEERAATLRRNRALATLGLVAPDEIEPIDQVGVVDFFGYYNANTNRITVVRAADRDPLLERLVVVHEFVHAFQDQYGGFPEPLEGTADGVLAQAARIEGDAVLHEVRAQVEFRGLDFDSVEWGAYFRDWQNERIGEYGQASSFAFQARRAFAYPFGGEDAVLDFLRGPQPNLAQLRPPRRSTADVVLHTDRPAPARVYSDLDGHGPPVPAELVAEDRLGPWLVWAPVLSAESPSPAAVHGLFRAYVTDRVALYALPGERAAAVWRIELATEADADRLVAALDAEASLFQDGPRLSVVGVSDGEDLAAWERFGRTASSLTEASTGKRWHPAKPVFERSHRIH